MTTHYGRKLASVLFSVGTLNKVPRESFLDGHLQCLESSSQCRFSTRNSVLLHRNLRLKEFVRMLGVDNCLLNDIVDLKLRDGRVANLFVKSCRDSLWFGLSPNSRASCCEWCCPNFLSCTCVVESIVIHSLGIFLWIK